MCVCLVCVCLVCVCVVDVVGGEGGWGPFIALRNSSAMVSAGLESRKTTQANEVTHSSNPSPLFNSL